jgi:hypothetical protein
MKKKCTSMKFTVPYYYFPFIYVTSGPLECGIYLYREGFVDEVEETRQEGEDEDATMFSRHDGVDVSLFNGLQQIFCHKICHTCQCLQRHIE